MSLSITATISLTIKPVAALTREEVRSKKVPLLVVEASDLRLGVEAGDDVLGPGDGGGGPAARHAGRPAALQLPHGGGEPQHQRVPLLQQADVLPGDLLAPEHITGAVRPGL